MTKLGRTSLLLSLALLLGGCSSLNPFSSREPGPASLESFDATAELSQRWQVSVGGAGDYHFQPIVVDGSVYAAGHNGTVVRVDEGGSTAWRTRLDDSLAAGVGSNGRLAVVVTTNGEVVALDAENGEELWRTRARAEVLAPPAVGDRTVAVRTSDNRILGFAGDDGERSWEYQRRMPPLSLRNVAGMTVEGNDAIVGYPGGKLVAISLDNGGPLWELTVATPRGVTEIERIADVAGTPVLGRNDVCAVAYQGRVACFDLQDGRSIWSRDLSSSVGLDRDTRFVFVTDTSDTVHALDAFGGASAWEQDALARRQVSRPLAVGDFVVVGDLEGYVHALDRDDGAFAQRTRADRGRIAADPVSLGGQRFVVQTRNGGLYAYELR